jgi:hypothetical protein
MIRPAAASTTGRGARGARRRRARLQRGARGRRELGAVLPAPRWVLGERSRQDIVERRRHARATSARTRRLVLQMRVDRRDLRAARERHLARQTLEQHAPQRIQISPAVDLVAPDLLRRDVVDGPHHLPAHRRPATRRRVLGQPEVRQIDVLDAALHRDQRIARLDIAMDQPTRMRRVQGAGELCHKRHRALRSQRSIAPQQSPQVGALDVPHPDVQQAIDLAGLEDRHDARVIDRRRQARLRQETLAKAVVLRQLRRQELQRHPPTEPQILRTVDGTHAAAPDQRLQPVTTQLRPNRGTRSHGHGEVPSSVDGQP